MLMSCWTRALASYCFNEESVAHRPLIFTSFIELRSHSLSWLGPPRLAWYIAYFTLWKFASFCAFSNYIFLWE